MRFARLTRDACRALSPGTKLTEHGIAFERLTNGDGRYSIAVMVDRQRVHRVIGLESEGVTRRQCEVFIERSRTDARQGRLNLPSRRKTVLGFARAAEEYLARLGQSGGRNLPQKRQQLDQHLVPFFGARPLASITGFEVQRYAKHRTGQAASHSTVNREIAVLSHLFARAVEWRWTAGKPAIKRLKEGPGRITYLTPEQIERLLTAAAHDTHPHVHLFIQIALATGMRRMEILRIRREDIDPDKRTIHSPRAKAGARVQPITADLAVVLRSRQGEGWLFPAHSAPGHTVAIERAFRRVVAAAGLDPKEVTRHTLRHTAISHLVLSGVDLPTVARISGHKTLSMVARYSHQSGAHIATAMDRLEGRYTVRTVTQELHKDEKGKAGETL
jgi:integrase